MQWSQKELLDSEEFAIIGQLASCVATSTRKLPYTWKGNKNWLRCSIYSWSCICSYMGTQTAVYVRLYQHIAFSVCGNYQLTWKKVKNCKVSKNKFIYCQSALDWQILVYSSHAYCLGLGYMEMQEMKCKMETEKGITGNGETNRNANSQLLQSYRNACAVGFCSQASQSYLCSRRQHAASYISCKFANSRLC